VGKNLEWIEAFSTVNRIRKAGVLAVGEHSERGEFWRKRTVFGGKTFYLLGKKRGKKQCLGNNNLEKSRGKRDGPQKSGECKKKNPETLKKTRRIPNAVGWEKEKKKKSSKPIFESKQKQNH